jgi:hypothetical protein
LAARFAAVRVRVADGPTQRIREMGGQHMGLTSSSADGCSGNHSVPSDVGGVSTAHVGRSSGA